MTVLDLEALGDTVRPRPTRDDVRAAVERAVADRPRLVLPAPTRSDVDAYFGELAELVKRAKGEP